MCFIGSGWDMGKAKLIQQIMAMRESVIHEILLDLQKAYNTLDRESCIKIITR